METKNFRAIKTLIRNKIKSSKNWNETQLWFHEKGINVEVFNDYYFLDSDLNGKKSELSGFCNSVIYKNNELMCFHGSKLTKSTLEKEKENNIINWNDSTIFIEYLEGKEAYMFWDKFSEKWVFSDDKKMNSPYRKIIENNIYNIMSLDPAFTYCFLIVEGGNKSGIYLTTMFNTNNCTEVSWEDVYRISIKIKMKHPDIYRFQGFNELEESDFPLYVKDSSDSLILLEKLK